ncbi:MAG TPA: hypothetical protein VL084_03620 [Thermoanaerobaculia bacterium]|nr:hypothetical protein [Thermoanaerobaculia bacterium]
MSPYNKTNYFIDKGTQRGIAYEAPEAGGFLEPHHEERLRDRRLGAGLVQYLVVDDSLARFWAGVLPAISLHPDVALRTGGEIAWAFRKNSPLLKAEVNAFLARYPEGSAGRP